ncbi:hypothetical protein SLS62_002577 [Diatrype stigma]|uniref:Calpain catalytic domain-containing protein n=1 Tax=Diatrype stigma TaxID=117547 RepID=A0AAN9UWV6_9PEZI
MPSGRSASPTSRPTATAAARRDLTAFGYSSSSESDEAPCKSNNTSNNNQNQKKKKKKRPPPQQSINKIWRRFASKQPTKALAILPFDPVPLPSTPERPNEFLSAGYERARDECSRKDWDLKWVKGNCLNYLGSNKFNIAGPRLSTSTSVPKAVKRVHEIFEKPTFMKSLSPNDVKQGALGDCWFISSLSALVNVEEGLKRVIEIGIYGFVFYRDGEWIYSIVDDKLYLTSPNWDSPSMQRDLLNQLDRDNPEREYRKTYQTGSKALFFGQCKDQNETWVPLIEKAYAKAHGDFASLSGGWIGEGLEDLSGGVTTELLASDILDLDGFWENELSKVNQEFLFGCSTGLLDGGYGERNGIREGHAYVVMDARTLKTGERLVKLRNPWGKNRKGIWEGAWSDGSKEWNREVKEELNHEFGNDSVFWITFEDLLEKYQHFDRTRMFRDPDWRCCQRWIGVEVPWKPQWNEKFHIKLTKESPLVLVLQQLDNRYYKGLHGQYNFRLHFRVHEQGRPDAEDYIVRSHGNYLMDRSISVELPCMEPGNYSVWVSVVGERDTDISSVEDVVKRECLKRVENEKLAQVGYAYDLAHSKGVAHLEQVAKLRKKSDHKKASSSRMAERRKLWEKRHVNREINRKQQKKNQEKRDKRREADAAEKREKAEAEAATKKVKEEAEEAERKNKEEAAATERKEKEAADEAERKKQEEEKPKDVAVQTDKTESGDDKSVQTELGDTSSKNSSESSETSKDTPKDEKSEPTADESKSAEEKAENVKDPSASRDAPPETDISEEKKETNESPAPPAYDSECDSSDSPVEDWELMYSSDDMSKKPRMAAPPPPANDNDNAVESDGESRMPEPWNAVCIVGFRVYSKDEALQLHVVMEGGELTEGGMGEKGAADIDNAQANAGGAREDKKDGEKTTDEVEIIDGVPVEKKKIVVEGETNPKEAVDSAKGGQQDQSKPDDKDDAAKSENSDSSESSPVNTPDSTMDGSTDCSPQAKPGRSTKLAPVKEAS